MHITLRRSPISRAATILAVTASLAVAGAPSGAAHAEGLTVTTSDGRVLTVGSVVASGTRDGDVCMLPDTAEIRLSGSNTNVATFTADPNCNVSISKITEATNRPITLALGARPKIDLDTVAASGGVGGVGTIGTLPGAGDVDADAAIGTVDGLVSAAKPKWQQEIYTIHVTQPVYDALGVRQYEDWYQIQYVEEWNDTDGRVRDVTPMDGACVGGIGGDVIGYDPVTTIRSCWYTRIANGYSRVEVKGGGWYRQGVRIGGIGVTTDERIMSETVAAWYLGWDYSCNLGGSLPISWSSECWAIRTS